MEFGQAFRHFLIPTSARQQRTGRTRSALRTWLAMVGAMLAIVSLLPASVHSREPVPSGDFPTIAVKALPAEARTTLVLIERGGPFPYRKDGVVFGNRERALPDRPRGYYREYTVPTPGAPDRGGRRIVAGQRGERYYSADHYRTFKRIVE